MGKPPPALGTVWVARATLFDNAGHKIGTCTDTPNAIAKAFMEMSQATMVKPFGEEYRDRKSYFDRMNKRNTCPSGLQRIHDVKPEMTRGRMGK
jgi:hypothetical protein